MKLVKTRRALVACTMLFATRAAAQSADDVAKAHFNRGLDAFQRQSFADAIAAFEAAYAASPRFFILRNLGLAYDAVGRSVEAVDALRRYLETGKDQVPLEKRREAEALIRENEAKIGRLALTTTVGALVRIDGKSVGTAPLSEIRLAMGKHHISVTLDGHEPRDADVDIVPKRTTTIDLTLTRREAGFAQLVVVCPVKAATVVVDNNPVGQTPLGAPVPVSEGSHRVEFRRRGYAVDEQAVVVKVAREQRKVFCKLSPLNPLPPDVAGTLEVRTKHGATIQVDGERTGVRSELPEGPHDVLVSLEGHAP